ncbi:MAG: ribonuclease Y [Coriobacteriia bacterium]|nr:ribonuclease Y [Coriobacteriia bacterium]MBS5478906.1 ribonuclease Y [Coriobacteriia bacterium]
MTMPDVLLIAIAAIVALAVGVVLALLFATSSSNGKIKRAGAEASRVIDDARKQAEAVKSEAETAKKEALIGAKEEILRQKQAAEEDERQRKGELRSMESRLMQREESLDRRSDALDKREHQLASEAGAIEKKTREADEMLGRQQAELERISGLTVDDAHAELLDRVRDDVTKQAANIIRDSEQRVRLECDKTARDILSTAIQRLASDHVAEVTLTTVHIPSDDLKGRIIGREGRNIRTFEQMTGVNLIIDDTPETVQLSSFDPVRREIARVTLENLIADGRIHPARIEELFNKATDQVNAKVLEAGESACFDLDIHDLHPELVRTLGSLRYRTSYGQNVLSHSIEVAQLCEIMASELGIDPAPARRAGLLHDIGKAIDHQVEGPHAVIGAELARRYGESPAIVHAIEAHHNDVDPSTVLDVLVQAGDAVSAARPGARRESAESYVKRLEKLEEISNAHKGVERTYAMQAGREIRVMVRPEEISDADSVVLAHDIATEIEEKMQYPGQVKVVVIRESRATDIAK